MNPVQEAYDILVKAMLDTEDLVDPYAYIEEAIGYLGEALGSESDYA